jgi:hypothetical protein
MQNKTKNLKTLVIPLKFYYLFIKLEQLNIFRRFKNYKTKVLHQ